MMSSRRSAAVFVVAMTATACGNLGTLPAPPEITTGTFELLRIDGELIPRTINISGRPCSISSSTLTLYDSQSFHWDGVCGGASAVASLAFGVSSVFRQAARDSIVFPVPPPLNASWAAARLTGSTLTLRTLPLSETFGEHTWTFSRVY